VNGVKESIWLIMLVYIPLMLMVLLPCRIFLNPRGMKTYSYVCDMPNAMASATTYQTGSTMCCKQCWEREMCVCGCESCMLVCFEKIFTLYNTVYTLFHWYILAFIHHHLGGQEEWCFIGVWTKTIAKQAGVTIVISFPQFGNCDD